MTWTLRGRPLTKLPPPFKCECGKFVDPGIPGTIVYEKYRKGELVSRKCKECGEKG